MASISLGSSTPLCNAFYTNIIAIANMPPSIVAITTINTFLGFTGKVTSLPCLASAAA